VFAATSCPCDEHLDTALADIAATGRGILLYLRDLRPPHPRAHLGLSCGTRNGDTVGRLREYSAIHHILTDLNVHSIRLLSTGPTERDVLRDLGTKINNTEPAPHQRPPSGARTAERERLQ
jgi:3,4-dihydroxy 2-butanone 4-phosphate synthase / GTP cyclohydrolase II